MSTRRGAPGGVRRFRLAACAALLCLAAAPRAGGAQALLRLVDDLGAPLAGPVEVCFQAAGRSDCTGVAPDTAVRVPQELAGLRVEGAGYGPLALRRQNLTAAGDGSVVVAVPRKALLVIDRPAPGAAAGVPFPAGDRLPLAVSLFPPGDASFRDPAWRASLEGPAWQAQIPAGQYLVSLAQSGTAPDLHRLAAPPGSQVRLAYRRLSGWSLVVRCRTADGGRPVGGVRVNLAAASGAVQAEQPLAGEASTADGLALVSGITAGLVHLSASHPAFLPADLHGIGAAAGALTLREVALSAGGRLAAHVAVHGRPLSGAGCELVALESAADDHRVTAREVWKGGTDAGGRCRSPRLAVGGYRLKVRIPDSSSVVSRWVNLVEGQDSELDLALTPARVSGVVRRGNQSVAGYVVLASTVPVGEPAGAVLEPAGEATTDDTGRYELTLWAAGRYILRLRSPAGGSVAGNRNLTLLGDDDQTVDFDLNAAAFTGAVVDESGQPVPGAKVAVTYWKGGVMGTTDGGGNFSIDAEGEGAATLQAVKPGYSPSDEKRLQVTEDAPIPPVTLVLRRRASVRGTVVSAAGEPLAGVLVTSLIAAPGGFQAVGSATSGADGTFEVTVSPGPLRAILSGPACPLSVASLAPQDGVGDDTDPAATTVVTCPAQAAVLALTLVDGSGQPVTRTTVQLLLGGIAVPPRVLAQHLALLGLPAESDADGHLVLAGLAPGDVGVLVGGPAASGAAGGSEGPLTAVALAPQQTTAVQVTVPVPP